MRNPIILALDLPSAEAALLLARELSSLLGAVKIGSELFTTGGPEIVRQIRATGLNVFLDLKFHDIPNTVARSVASAVHLDVQMLTVHTSGGSEMMRAAEKSATETATSLGRPAPLVLGVTILTSMDSNAIAEVGCEPNVARQVERLAKLAANSGMRGLVCSPLEVADLRQLLPTEMQFVTPGIRPAQSASDDQKRTLTPKEALEAGASWLVIGRPIYGAKDPRTAAEQILQTLV
ncbi:MAG TPA: orotidine-5'-phosphate decarboxylase [Verrucomicrobiae bacterium]|nr:orotidine-5'-phosphate decarboxylase [Verrucomicrobiae bacterium]